MELSKATDQQHLKAESMDISSTEEVPDPPKESTDSQMSVVATVPEVPDTRPVTPETANVLGSVDCSDDVMDSSIKVEEVNSSKASEDTNIVSAVNTIEAPEIPQSSKPSEDIEMMQNPERKEGDEKPLEPVPVQEEESVMSSDMKNDMINDEDLPEKLTAESKDLEEEISLPLNEEHMPLDGTLIIDEGEEHRCASSPDDLEPELNERTGTFEKRKRSSRSETGDAIADTVFEQDSSLTNNVLEIDLSTPQNKNTTKDSTPKLVKGTTVEKTDTKLVWNSIDDSIERCIANHTCDSPPGSPGVNAQLKDVAKFAQKVGFKIITNRINLKATMRKGHPLSPNLKQGDLRAGTTLVKKVKTKSKKGADKAAPQIQEAASVEGLAQKSSTEKKGTIDNSNKDTQPSSKLADSEKVCFSKLMDKAQKEETPTKEHPISCLKVRDVESINATIPIKVPITEVVHEDRHINTIQAFSSQEPVNPTNFSHEGSNDPVLEMEPESSQALGAKTSSTGVALRPIAPKFCIASNDQQTVKLIRDLIQLPSVPVYVPEDTVSLSKHFSGRLHLCHGCGDRFVLLKSLLEHQNRRSCVIRFQCLKCDSAVLCFFNRCEFIRHLYNHNQTLTNTMLQLHIIVDRLPSQTSNIVFDVKICHECKLFLNVPLAEHMCGADQKDKKPDLALKCQWCSLMLLTKCSYQAHRRMHFLQAPHVCPECGDLCSDLNTFNTHINSVCYHTSKRSLFHCSFCMLEMFDARKLERHIRNKHIKDVFKCNFCFVACFNLRDLDKHRQQHHEDKLAEEQDTDDENGLKYAFHLCDMCPNRLIRRIRLGQHLWDHTYSTNDVRYVYECRKCKATYNSKDLLVTHTATCTASAPANTPMLTAVLPNGANEALMSANSLLVNSSDPLVAEDLESVASKEGSNEFADTAIIDELSHSPENELMLIDDIDAPPPLTKAPVLQSIKVTAPPKNINKIKKNTAKLISVKPDHVMFDKPKEASNCSDALPADMSALSSELEGSMEVALQCLDCGGNLTSELGSYCTSCEQKREAGDEGIPATAISSLLAAEKKGAAAPKPLLSAEKKGATSPKPPLSREKKGAATHKPPLSGEKKGAATPKPPLSGEKKGATAPKPPLSGGKKGAAAPKPPLLGEKKAAVARKPNSLAGKTDGGKPTLSSAGKSDSIKKTGPGNFTCRLCNALISRTCDKAAIKRHFISKHKEIFIAALQTGMEPRKLLPKGEKIAALTQNQGEVSPSTEGNPVQVEKGPAVKTSFLKRPLPSPSKASPKKKKKQKKALYLQQWHDSDTEDDSVLNRFSFQGMKKSKDKKKKNYSPLPALDQGLTTPGEVVTEQVGDLRTCYKCSFQSASKELFMTHVATHKTNPRDLQCPACGTCFVVRPSLEKHLLIFHGMRNVDEYLEDHGFSPVERETTDRESEVLDMNQCKVCHSKFDSEALLEKHFRTHGSAFLLSNKFRRS